MKLLKFQASWCGPCKRLTENLQHVNFPYEVQEIELDDNLDLAVEYGVRSVPRLILLDDEGNQVAATGTPSSMDSFIEEFVTPYQ